MPVSDFDRETGLSYHHLYPAVDNFIVGVIGNNHLISELTKETFP
ncbi:hypothetical protein ES703_46844 [subsurface metagenome]